MHPRAREVEENTLARAILGDVEENFSIAAEKGLPTRARTRGWRWCSLLWARRSM